MSSYNWDGQVDLAHESAGKEFDANIEVMPGTYCVLYDDGMGLIRRIAPRFPLERRGND